MKPGNLSEEFLIKAVARSGKQIFSDVHGEKMPAERAKVLIRDSSA